MFHHPPRLLFTHPDFFLVAKPANISFHADGGVMPAAEGESSHLRPQLPAELHGSDSASELPLLAQIRALCREHYGDATLFPVHRLDHITSGLLLFARHAEAARAFGNRFAEGGIDKCYLALSARQPSKKQGWVKGNMVKGRNGSWRLSNGAGLHAISQFFSYGLGKVGQKNDEEPDSSLTLRLFLVRPHTGRTHQIRVALKSVGSPILGDSRYGGAPADRAYLHALALRFEWQGQPFSFYLPPDEGTYFQEPACQAKLKELGDPWALGWPG